MSETEKIKKSPVKRALKWVGISVAVLVILLLLILVAAHFILRSGTLTQTALSKINPITEPFGVQISQLSSAQIDIFGLIDIRGLVLDWQDDELGNAHVVAENFRLDYSFNDLWSKQLTVNEILIQGVQVKAELAASEDSEPVDLAELAELLSQPPLEITINNVELADIGLDLTFIDGDSKQRLQGNLENISSDLKWDADQFKLNAALALNQEKAEAWRLVLHEPGTDTEINFLPKWQANIALDLRNSNEQWRLPELLLNQTSIIEKISIIESTNGAMHTLLDGESIEFNMQTKKAPDSQATPASNGLEGLLPIALVSQVTTKLNAINIDFNDKQDTTLKTSLSQSLSLELANTINALEPFNTEAKYSLSQRLSAANVDFSAAGQAFDTKDLLFQLTTNGSAAVTSPQDIAVNAKSVIVFSSDQVTFKQPASAENSQAIQAVFTPQVKLTMDVDSLDINNPLNSQLQLQPDITLKNILAELTEVGNGAGNKETYRILENNLKSTIILQDKTLRMDADIALQKVDVPQLKKVVSINNTLELNTDLEGENTDLTLLLTLDKTALLTAKVNAKNQQDWLAIAHQIDLDLPLWLSQLHEAGESLELLGHTQVSLNGNSRIKHSATNIQTANTDLIEQWPAAVQGSIELKQLQKPNVKEGIIIDKPLTLDYDIDKAEVINTDLTIKSAGIQLEPILMPVPIEFNNQSQLTWPLSTSKSKGFLNVDQERALKFDLTMIDKPKLTHLNGNIFVSASPHWQKYLAELKEMEAVGQLTVNIEPDVTINHSANNVLEIDPAKLDDIALDVTLKAVISQSDKLPGTELILAQPVNLSQSLKWSTQAVDSVIEFSLGSLEIPDQLLIESLPGKIELTADNGLQPTKADISIRLEPAKILLSSETEGQLQTYKMNDVLTPLDFKLSAQQQGALAIIDQLSLNLGNGFVVLQGSGNGAIDGSEAQLDVTLTSTLNEQLFNDAGLIGSGSFNLPVKVSYIDGEQVTLNGAINFNQFNLAFEQQKIENLNGSINVDQELLMRDEFFGFRYVLNADPFQRVDFSRIQPYLETENALRFSNIQVGDLQFGPGMASISINQNLINVQRLDLELFQGSMMGQVFFDAQPGGQKFGLLSRISRIDARELLADTSQEKTSEYAPLSARTAITFDVTERLMEGEIDLMEINKIQLLQLLELVDPEHKDEQIATVRSALRFAHPQWVKVDMQSGLMNIEVAISALPKPMSIRGLPLTPLIQQYASDIEEALVQLPLRNM